MKIIIPGGTEQGGTKLACAFAAIGAFFIWTETELILKTRRIVPGRLMQSGFTFQFPTWPEAAEL